jgi:type II secretory pathway pseudopilin PulG
MISEPSPPGHVSAHRQRGVSLVEGLVALVVMGFGMLTIVGFQANLLRHADMARQRTEATRLAQNKLEELRAFEQLAPAPGKAAYEDIDPGNDSPALNSNTAYERSWSIGGDAADLHRLVSVRVDWPEDAGDAGSTSVTLHTVIARADPADAGALALPNPGNDALRRAFHRHRDIPYEAGILRGANRKRSTLRWEGREPGTLVFDDVSGEVVALCALPPADDTDVATQCVAVAAYLLQGHIGGIAPGSLPTLAFDRLEYLRAGSSPDCIVTEATSRSGGAIGGIQRYRCLIQPTDHDRDAATPRVWSGRLRLAGLPAGAHTCRYAVAESALNVDHPETYTLVQGSLDHQNFLLIEAGECPGGTILHPDA